jgi:signal transduction histidine kinase/CheY-like chemotaxis protein
MSKLFRWVSFNVTPCVYPVVMIAIVLFPAVQLALSGMLLLIIIVLIRRQARLRRQLREAQHQLDAQAQKQDIMVHNITHEARTPLNAIIGFSEQLSHVLLRPDHQELLDSVKRAGTQLMYIVGHLHDLNRLHHQELSLNQQPFSIYPVFSELMFRQRARACAKRLFFDFSYDGDKLLQAIGDCCRFEQILRQLTDNALRYTDEGSVIVKMKVARTDAGHIQLVCSVADTGQGIAPAILPNIFDYYAHERPARHLNAVSGAGLGLSVVRGLLELQGGEISVQSVEGQGSEFTISMPFLISQAPQTMVITQREVEHMEAHFMEGRYVLVADDQDMNLLLMEKILTRWRCRFDKASDGLAAYQLFCTNRYDMVFLDLQMPRMTGVDVVNRIRQDSDSDKAQVPVLALTADTSFIVEDRFRKEGFDDCLLKPFRERDVYRTVIKYLRPVESEK